MSAFHPLQTLPNQVRGDDDYQDGDHSDARYLHPRFHEREVSSGELAMIHRRKLLPPMAAFHAKMRLT